MEKEKVICLDDEDGDDILSEEDDIEEEVDDDEEEEDIEALGENGEKKAQQRKKGEESGKDGNKIAEQVKIGEENSKGGNDSTKPKFKKPQKRSNKISLEELTKQISQNLQKRVGGGDKDIKGTFDWIQYSSEDDRTLNYVNDFVEQNKSNALDYMRLDLSELESVEKVSHHHSQVSSITDDLYKRILRYGQVESISSIAKKSGALKKGESTANNFRDELFYDQNDPFIDDDEYTNQAKGSYQQRMQLAEVFLDDFRSFYGDLPEFVNSEIYTHRVQIMHNLESKNTQQEQTQQEVIKKKKKQASLVNSNVNNNNTSKNSSNTLSVTAAVTATAKAIPIPISSDKKSVTDLEKEIAGSSFSEPFKTHEKKKQKKDNINNNTNNLPKSAQVNLLSASMNSTQIPAGQSLPQVQQDSVTQAMQNLNKNVSNNNNNTTTNASAAALSQLLQQQQQQQQQSQHSSLLQNLQLENYQKNQSNQLSQYYMPYQGMILPNYYDTQAAAQSLFLNSNMMLQYTQPNNLSATNFIYQSATPTTTSKAPAYQINPTADLHLNQTDINKDKKKKKKQTTNIKDPLNLEKKQQQGKRDFIEIEDDDDLAKQKTQAQ